MHKDIEILYVFEIHLFSKVISKKSFMGSSRIWAAIHLFLKVQSQTFSSGICWSIIHYFFQTNLSLVFRGFMLCNTFIFSREAFAGVSWVCDTLIFWKKLNFAGREGVVGRFAGLWHIHFFKETFRGGFTGLWLIYFFEIFRGGGGSRRFRWSVIHSFFKMKKKNSQVCERFVFQRE